MTVCCFVAFNQYGATRRSFSVAMATVERSPWPFVIAAVIGALARLGRAGEESAAVLALLV